jgi:hypothetical protein
MSLILASKDVGVQVWYSRLLPASNGEVPFLHFPSVLSGFLDAPLDHFRNGQAT